MKTFVNSVFLFLLVNVFSQGNVGPSNVIIPNGQPASGVIDGVYEKKDVLAKKRAIPLEDVRENDYVWGKRTWSYIDLREKFNHSLYYPHEKIDQKNQASKPELVTEYSAQGRYSLYYVLANALKKGQLMGYADRIEADLSKGILVGKDGGDAFIFPARRDYSKPAQSDGNYQSDIGELIGVSVIDPDKNEKMAMINGSATPVYVLKGTPPEVKVYLNGDVAIETVDPQTETTDPSQAEIIAGTSDAYPVEYRVRNQKYVEPYQIVKYLLKEDWFFDKERSIMDVRIIGLAPVIMDSTTFKEKILFWVYFPHARDILKNYYAYSDKSTVGGNTFDHLFLTRKFNEVVYKESSLKDNTIKDYLNSSDAIYQSEKVRNNIRMIEHDVWNF